jgi:hypothetical protein
VPETSAGNEQWSQNQFKFSSRTIESNMRCDTQISRFDEQTASRAGSFYTTVNNTLKGTMRKEGEFDELLELLWSLDQERWKEDGLTCNNYTSLSGKLRRVTVDWLIGLSCSIEGDRDLLFRSVHQLDVFLATRNETINRAELPLIALACMVLQAAPETSYDLQLADWIAVSKTNLSTEQLRQMAESINATQQQATKPFATAHQVLNTIGNFLGLSQRQMTISQYVMEGTLMLQFHNPLSATVRALAVLLITQDLEGRDLVPTAFIEKLGADVQAVVEMKEGILRFLLKLEAKNHVSNWRKKYSHPLYLQVGLISLAKALEGGVSSKAG